LKKNKIFLAFFLIFFISTVSATTFGSERDISVFIDTNNFGYTHEVEANEVFYLNVRIIDQNSLPLRNYHIDLKVEDQRGVLINDYSKEEKEGKIYRIISDDNGFINFAFPINVCGALQEEFCYEVEETYTFRIIQKDLDHRENFRIIPQTLEHNWIGQGLRWIIFNMEYLFIVLILFIILISILFSGYWFWKNKR